MFITRFSSETLGEFHSLPVLPRPTAKTLLKALGPAGMGESHSRFSSDFFLSSCQMLCVLDFDYLIDLRVLMPGVKLPSYQQHCFLSLLMGTSCRYLIAGSSHPTLVFTQNSRFARLPLETAQPLGWGAQDTGGNNHWFDQPPQTVTCLSQTKPKCVSPADHIPASYVYLHTNTNASLSKWHNWPTVV